MHQFSDAALFGFTWFMWFFSWDLLMLSKSLLDYFDCLVTYITSYFYSLLLFKIYTFKIYTLFDSTSPKPSYILRTVLWQVLGTFYILIHSSTIKATRNAHLNSHHKKYLTKLIFIKNFLDMALTLSWQWLLS